MADHDMTPFVDHGGHSYDIGLDALFDPSSNEHEKTCLTGDEQFRDAVERMHQTPSKAAAEFELREGDFYSVDGTLLHYIASRRSMGDVMKEALRFCARHRYPLDDVDSSSLTAMQIALNNDRADNVKFLLSFGAAMPNQNNMGESPIHVAIMTTQNPEIVGMLLYHHYHRSRNAADRNGAKVPVGPGSKKSGQVALDLLVGRVLQELSSSGESQCTELSKQVLYRIQRWSPTNEDTSYLREHVRNDHLLFSRAIIAVGNLSFAFDLSNTMMTVLREETATMYPGFYDSFWQAKVSTSLGMGEGIRQSVGIGMRQRRRLVNGPFP